MLWVFCVRSAATDWRSAFGPGKYAVINYFTATEVNGIDVALQLKNQRSKFQAMTTSPKFKNLPFWTAHGVIAATPSFIAAISNGFNSVESILGMIAGVVVLILIYSLLTSTGFFSISRPESAFSCSLRLAAHLRVFFAVLSTIAVSATFIGHNDFLLHTDHWLLQTILVVDFWTGVVGIYIAQFLIHVKNVAALTGFGGTLLTTLTTGIVFSIEFFVLSIVVTGIRWSLIRIKRNFGGKLPSSVEDELELI